MPPLPTSAASALFSPKALAGLVVFIVTLLGVAGLLWVVRHVSGKLAKRRVCVSDIEKATVQSNGATPIPPQSSTAKAKKNAAARTLMCARTNLKLAQTNKYPDLTTVQVTPARKGMVNISGSRLQQLKTIAAPARVGARRTPCRPGPSPLRFVLAPKASLASVLQAVPARVPVESVALKFPSTLFAISTSDSGMSFDSDSESDTGSNDPSPLDTPRTVLALKSAVITETPSPRPVAAIPVIIVHPAPVLALSDASTSNAPCTESVSAVKTPVGRKRSGSFRGFKHAEMRSSSSKDKENRDVDKARFLRVSSAHRSAGALRS